MPRIIPLRGRRDFGPAELGQQVQAVAEGLQLLMGFFRQEIAGSAWRSLSLDDRLSRITTELSYSAGSSELSR